MLIFCVFSLFFTVSNGQNYQKMVLIYGEPTVGNGYSTHEISWEQCYSLCYWDTNCSLSYYYSSQCVLYQYGDYSIKQLTSSEEKLISVKRNLTTCPSKTVQIVGTDSYEVNDIVYINRTTSNGTHWLITYNSTFQCENETKLFRRDNYWVCVGVQFFPRCSQYSVAKNMCNESGWEIRTGPFSSQELTYFLSQKGGRRQGLTPVLWVDGYKGQIEDRTLKYKKELLQYGYLNNVDCAYIGHPTNYNVINIGKCDWSTYLFCWTGVTCLKKYVDVS
ncbi:hypothetical protein CAEBREN_23201 [Caenorhabditis brenneri]|uniref:PAN-3 domain-containing protein n=1 Tax=Caenorhabditis brenneri TaxID=135651 RepID=G0PBY1_CAEBE|nr:hypothetical protein CAEBREN_23201 [Caenorhabditis brenneri]